MAKDTELRALYIFGQILMKHVRDLTIREEYNIIAGITKAPVNIELYKKLKLIPDDQKETLKNLVVDAVDGALNNFLWLIEQSDDFDLVAYKNKETFSLKGISDGLCGDYWNFVEEFSEYTTAAEMLGYDFIEETNQEKSFSETYLVELFSESPEEAKRYFIRTLNNKENYELLKSLIPKIPSDILKILIEMTVSRSSFHKDQCAEIKDIMEKKNRNFS
ncbi:hypothetical protein [Candidatus Nucleicultrix amoebiphila]|jgi:hypothetical protein|uniref:Uncharacterized protein n=1 Tax=Candidatus Nucleicultrix amoebiphila FS5 TaxID=1414854 RepID=A0A1W6N4X8_9PROT|nr:hypothetical protein [Candidatus Nucleicultrix amoebiphila]ARN84930.1 hypothetical protein GQ61_06125 [Candidatus Nucleicultrix amoebiphila FS5]